MKLSTFLFVFSATILAITALPLQDTIETTAATVADANDALPTEATGLARQDEEPQPTDAPAPDEAPEEDEEEGEDSPTERATTLRTAPAALPSRPKIPSSSFAQEWAIVTGNVAPVDLPNKRQQNEQVENTVNIEKEKETETEKEVEKETEKETDNENENETITSS